MSFKEKFQNFKTSIKSDKKDFIKKVLVIFLLMLLVGVCAAYFYSVQVEYLKRTENNLSSNIVSVGIDNKEITESRLEDIKNIENVKEIFKMGFLSILDLPGASFSDFYINGVKYTDVQINFYDKIPNTYKEEFNNISEEEFFIYGDEYKDSQSIVLSEAFLAKLNLDLKDINNELKFNIEIGINGVNEKILENGIISGVLNKDVRKISVYEGAINLPEIYLPYALLNKITNKQVANAIQPSIVAFANNYSDISQIKKDINENISADCVFWKTNEVMRILETQKIIAMISLLVIGIVSLCLIIFAYIHFINKNIKNNEHHYASLLNNATNVKDVFGVVLIEELMAFFIAFLFVVMITPLLLFLVNLILNALTCVSIVISWINILYVVLTILTVGVVFVILVSLFSYKKIKNN